MTTNKTPNKCKQLILVMFAFALAHLHFLVLPDLFVTWDRQTRDRLIVLRNAWRQFKPVYDPKVVHLDLTDSSLAAIDGYTFHRGQFAAATRILGAAGTAAQMWDFIFAARMDPQMDADLVRSTAAAGNVYSGLALKLKEPYADTIQNPTVSSADVPYVWHPRFIGDASAFPAGADPVTAFDDLAGASRGVAALNIRYDVDGVLRRVPLLIRYGGGFVPILPLMVACDVLNVNPNHIEIKSGAWIRLPGALYPGRQTAEDLRIPIDRHGNMLINFIGPWGVMDHYNIADIVKAADDRDLLELWRLELAGRIAVVSDLTTGAADVGTVPGDSAYPLAGVHANILHSIMTGSFIAEAGNLTMIVIEAVLLLLVWLLAIRFSSAAFCTASVGLGVAYLLAAMGTFLYAHILIGIVRPLQMLFFANAILLVYRYIGEEKAKIEGLRQRDEIRATFGRYLSNEVVEELMSSEEKREMGGESRNVTFLVSDLRGFTSMSGTLEPTRVIDILNRCLNRMLTIIARHGGTVDEIQGDGLLVFFGAPLRQENEAWHAVACAIDMQHALVDFNTEQKLRGLPALAMGVGIHAGDVVVGNIGSEQRAKYGAVGSAINMVYRIESYTTGGQVLVSATIRDALSDSLILRGVLDVQFKGVAETMTLFDVEGLRGDGNRCLPPMEAGRIRRLERPVDIEMFIVRSKAVSKRVIAATLVGFGDDAMEVKTLESLRPMTDLKLSIAAVELESAITVYGKALHADPRSGIWTVALTSVPENAVKVIRSMFHAPEKE